MGYNLKARGWDDVEERGNFEKLPADGYVCRIVAAEVMPSKKGNEMLVTCVDIAEGKFAGYFKKSFDHFRKTNFEAKWPAAATMYQNLFDADGKINGGLKALLKSVERSNTNFLINLTDFEPATLRDKFIGVIFGDEEWERNGKSGITARAAFPRDVNKIREGDFKIPEVKRLEKNSSSDDSYVANADKKFSEAELTDIDDPPF